ncbi:MAG: type II CAAX endopeptidase family protein [Hadesarchaea archaeon]|nr:type II CAAX endopeptidase family protein [Hadesarchaea archaeon]
MVLFSQMIQAEMTLGTVEIILLTVGFYVIIFLVVFALLRKEGEGISSLGFRVSGLTLIPLAVVFGFVAQLIWILILSVAGGLVFDFGALPAGTFLALVLVDAVLVAFVEESAFRGFIQRKLTAGYGFIRSLILTSFLFMIIHIQFYIFLRLMDPSVMQQATQLFGITAEQVWTIMLTGLTQTVIMIFALGLFLGYIYHKSNQNLVTAAIFHITFNIGGLIVLSYSNAQLVALSLDYWLFVVLIVIWAAIVGALVWGTTRAFKKLVRQ